MTAHWGAGLAQTNYTSTADAARQTGGVAAPEDTPATDGDPSPATRPRRAARPPTPTPPRGRRSRAFQSGPRRSPSHSSPPTARRQRRRRRRPRSWPPARRRRRPPRRRRRRPSPGAAPGRARPPRALPPRPEIAGRGRALSSRPAVDRPPVTLEHEELLVRRGPRSGLFCVVAVHSTVRGPSLGGCRMWRYDDSASGVADALRLSRAMTYKAACAGLPLGGGKGVIMLRDGPPQGRARRDVLLDFGETVDAVNGAYITAEDVGTSSPRHDRDRRGDEARQRPRAVARRLGRPVAVHGARRPRRPCSRAASARSATPR